jgi:diguanylate cyclase (GGDEF)-like protein
MEPIRPVEHVVDRPKDGSVAEGRQQELVTSLPDGILSDITHLLVSEGSPEKVLEAVAGALFELVPHDSLILYRAEPPVRLIRPVLVRDPTYHDQISSMGPHPYGVGITGIAAETRVPQLVNDVDKDPRGLHIPGTPEEEPESLIVVPLLARDELKGILSLYRTGENHHFSLQDFRLAIVFSELAALAIDNAEIRTRLEMEVITDHLTALHNHRFFHERLAEEMRRSSRKRFPVGLLIYDIDDFKRVNDTYGHLVGDQVLQGVASISRETCRQEEVICRIGGEEFAVILPGANLEDATALGERLREGIATVDFPSVGRVTVSVGVAEGPMHASSARELIACADLALLEAKVSGKDQVVVYAATSGKGRSEAGAGPGGSGPARDRVERDKGPPGVAGSPRRASLCCPAAGAAIAVRSAEPAERRAEDRRGHHHRTPIVDRLSQLPRVRDGGRRGDRPAHRLSRRTHGVSRGDI